MEAMDWLEYVRSEKRKPFNMARLGCRFPTDVIFKDGFDKDAMLDMVALDPTEDTMPQFSSDPETIVKQIVAYTLLLCRVKAYKNELDKNYGMLATKFAEQLNVAYASSPVKLFDCDKLIGQIRDYANAIAQREHKEEEWMDSKRIEDELNSL